MCAVIRLQCATVTAAATAVDDGDVSTVLYGDNSGALSKFTAMSTAEATAVAAAAAATETAVTMRESERERE